MQNLLLQGAVPVTMFFSLLMLRYGGDQICRTARAVLNHKNIQFTEQYAGDYAVDRAKADNASVCKILVNGRNIGNIPDILQYQKAPDEDIFARFFEWIGEKCCPTPTEGEHARLKNEKYSTSLDNLSLFGGVNVGDKPDVVLITDAHSWEYHFGRYYSIAQYLGAVIIMGGLVVSVWPALTGGGGAGPIWWDMVFFSTTIPIAVSGVYKEIAFQSVSDMDVWYLNGWVALPQFLVGLCYAPLGAIMTNLPIDQIPQNVWHGYQCWILGTNFIRQEYGYNCSIDLNCGFDGSAVCCDSCDGSLPDVSSISALFGVLLYMCCNIAYNVFLILVIKHGSAALMYATSTIVLPLGSIAFTIALFLGAHAQPFNEFTGVGLGVVITGLLIYRFIDMIIKSRQAKARASHGPQPEDLDSVK